jgi:hypothetical protein
MASSGLCLLLFPPLANLAGASSWLTIHSNAANSKDANFSDGKDVLNPNTKLGAIKGQITWVNYRGRHALHVIPLPGHERADSEEMLVFLPSPDFQDGSIDVDLAGAPRPGFPPGEKGFIGVYFRMEGDKQERVFLRPTNARADDQLQRNRTIAYTSSPDFFFPRLRQESPGVYESYVDMDPGAWTHLKIEVSGVKARIYLNNATQPCLIVNDLKQGHSHGKVALYAEVTTDAYFSNLKIAATP